MATFVPFTHWLLVRAEQMGFGRPKKLGMPKTKKKKVEVLEPSPTIEPDTVTTGDAPPSPAREAQPPQRAALGPRRLASPCGCKQGARSRRPASC